MKKLLLIVLGIIYYFLMQINILNLKEEKVKEKTFSFTIESHMPHSIKLHLGTKRYKIKSIVCDRASITFNNKRSLWFEKNAGEEQVLLKIGKGKVSCKAEVRNKGRYYIPLVKQKLTFFNYTILYILLGIPLLIWSFDGFIYILDRIKTKINFGDKQKTSTDRTKRFFIFLPFILVLGMILRIVYVHKFGITQFQHDWQGHVEFIKYISTHWSLPMPSKGLQFPQQPLYYVVSAGIYSIGMSFGMHSMQSMMLVGYFALFCSFIFLYYAYMFFTLITKSRWVQIVALSFLAFTPSLVYMSARINNDVLVMALSSVSLYYIVKSYQAKFNEDFYKALVAVSLLFMTKISAAPMELLLFSLLIVMYVKEENSVKIRNKLFIFSVVGTFLLAFTLIKTYLPIENAFHMVNSSGHFPGQHIQNLDIVFFSHLHLQQLFNVEYIHSYMKDTSLYTFPNHQYRTMLIGEFNYEEYLKRIEELKIIIYVIFSIGLIYILGFFAYLRHMISSNSIDKLLLVIFLFNLLLVLKFVFSYPSICNTDFRYFVPTFAIFAYIFSQGLFYLSLNKWLQYIVTILLLILSITEIVFIVLISS